MCTKVKPKFLGHIKIYGEHQKYTHVSIYIKASIMYVARKSSQRGVGAKSRIKRTKNACTYLKTSF